MIRETKVSKGGTVVPFVAVSTQDPCVTRDPQRPSGEARTDASQPFPVYDEWADDVIDGAPLGFKILMCAWAVTAVIGVVLVVVR